MLSTRCSFRSQDRIRLRRQRPVEQNMFFATLFIPNFCLQAALRDCAFQTKTRQPNENRDDPPAALIAESEKKPVILELNDAAQAAGVVIGMSPSQALARCLDLLVLTHARKQELALQEILLEKAFTLSPYVESTGPGLCTIQFFDHSDRRSALLRVLTDLRACQVLALAGAGCTPDISYLAAHRADPLLIIGRD